MEELFAEKYLDLDYKTDFYWNRHVIYSVAKIAARNSLKLKAHVAGIDFIYVNHSHVMGIGDEKDSFLQVTLQKIINGEELKVSSGEQYFDVVSLEDCVNGYLLIGQKGVSGSNYWVGSGDPQRLKEYLIRICKLYPSKFGIQFGEIEYNDVIIDKEEFSINKIIEHTGYKPNMTFEQIIVKVYNSLISH
jgi:nucleoside-diphosphate-sugar epimerase